MCQILRPLSLASIHLSSSASSKAQSVRRSVAKSQPSRVGRLQANSARGTDDTPAFQWTCDKCQRVIGAETVRQLGFKRNNNIQ